jgi:hypothetical protein
MAKVNSKDTETVINALVKHAQRLPKELYASLTWDRGKEMVGNRVGPIRGNSAHFQIRQAQIRVAGASLRRL